MMRNMNVSRGLETVLVVGVLALALTAAYYYGTTRSSEAVALPKQIVLNSVRAAGTPRAAVGIKTAKQPTTTVTTGAPRHQSVATARPATTTRATTRTTSSTHTVRRSVVTPTRSYDCQPSGSGSHSGSGSGGSGHGDCG